MNPDSIRSQRFRKGRTSLLITDTNAYEDSPQGQEMWELPLGFANADRLAKRFGGNATQVELIRKALLYRNA